MSKKKLFLIGLSVIYILLCCLCCYFAGIKCLFYFFCISFLFLCFFLLLIKNYKRCMRKERPTSYFQDLGNRNMKALIVGSGYAYKYITLSLDEKKIYYPLITYKRSLGSDFNVIKTYFSHIEENGKVKLVVDFVQSKKIKRNLFPADFADIHEHIFMELKSKKPERKIKYPYFFYTKYWLGYNFTSLLKKLNFYKNDGKFKINKTILNTKEMTYFIDKLLEINNFLKERNLNLELYIINNLKKEELSKIVDTIQDKCSIVLIENKKQLRENIL